MHWQEEAFVLSARKFGETSSITRVFSRRHGLSAGLVRGASGKTNRGVFQPGNRIAAAWQARLPEQLGTLKGELTQPVAALLMDSPLRLAALSSACAMLESALHEHEPQPVIYDHFVGFMEALLPSPSGRGLGEGCVQLPHPHPGPLPKGEGAVASPLSAYAIPLRSTSYGGQEASADMQGGSSSLPSQHRSNNSWAKLYVLLELDLLACSGYGLDLSSCAATGTKEDLVYVSPRSGRAVSREAGTPWRDKMLALPRFLMEKESMEHAADGQILEGLALTSHFLERWLYEPHGKKIPAARMRLIELLTRQSAMTEEAKTTQEALVI